MQSPKVKKIKKVYAGSSQHTGKTRRESHQIGQSYLRHPDKQGRTRNQASDEITPLNTAKLTAPLKMCAVEKLGRIQLRSTNAPAALNTNHLI